MQEIHHRFSRRVDNYIKYRPRYVRAVLDVLRADCALTPAHIIADIGSGTGLLSELFLQNGNAVFGVEPDSEMRAGGDYYLRAYPNFTSIAATAEATTLASNSVHFVTAGQAFHYFDGDKARREFARILKPHGWIVLTWNVHRAAASPFARAFEAFWPTRGTRRQIVEPFFQPMSFTEKVFPNPLFCDWPTLQGRVLSNRSGSLHDQGQWLSAMLGDLRALFQAHQVDGRVTIEQDLHVFYGRLQ